jgi:hypothetical protein
MLQYTTVKPSSLHGAQNRRISSQRLFPTFWQFRFAAWRSRTRFEVSNGSNRKKLTQPDPVHQPRVYNRERLDTGHPPDCNRHSNVRYFAEVRAVHREVMVNELDHRKIHPAHCANFIDEQLLLLHGPIS